MLAPLLALAMQVVDANRASTLYGNCRGAIRVQNDPDKATSADMERADICAAYLSGFVDATADRYFCVGDATMGTLARVYVAYMDAHPKRMEDGRARTVYDAFQDAYPCKAH